MQPPSTLLPGPVRLVRLPLDWRLEPEQAALLVRDDERPFALVGRWAGGGALIGSDPVGVARPDDDPFALLDCQPELSGTGGGAVGGGWFGWLGYGLGRRLEPVGAGPPTPAANPSFSLAFYDHVLRLDADGRWWFEALWSEQRSPALSSRMETLRARATRRPSARPFSTGPWRATPTAAGHALAVEACRRRIEAGDLFQANLCLRLNSRLEGAPIDLFVTAAAALRPDRAAYVGGPGGTAVASLSPELFLERHGRRVRSAPIKGTRPRPADPPLAAVQRHELAASAKDRAENVMIVDLVRNDLGRVCAFGSVGVRGLCRVRAHAGVFHLVSEVEGALRDGVGDGDLVRAAFPPGSVTGAPKVAAMNVIAELESTSRRLYTGAIGFASPVAGLELNVAIRTFEFEGERAWLDVGGGIVADSDPVAEAAECTTKAAPLLTAIGAAVDRGSPAAPAPLPPRREPRPVPRPDPEAGVFETLLVRDGEALELERHLARLAGSVAALYGLGLPPDLTERVCEAADGEAYSRMRVDVRRADVSITVRPVAAREVPVRLIPSTLPGGLGAHKWIDRRLLDAVSADGEPLLCDLDGLVLETARANLFVVDAEGRLLTAPADGRILPGVTRARVLELAEKLGLEVRITPLPLRTAQRAREMFVTGAIGGVEPAHLEGRTLEPGPVTARLAEALRPSATRPAAHRAPSTTTHRAPPRGLDLLVQRATERGRGGDRIAENARPPDRAAGA